MRTLLSGVGVNVQEQESEGLEFSPLSFHGVCVPDRGVDKAPARVLQLAVTGGVWVEAVSPHKADRAGPGGEPGCWAGGCS